MKIFFLKNKYVLFGLVLIAGIVFLPTFFNDFQNEWDDTWMLLENPYVINFSWSRFGHHLMHFYSTQYSPVNTLYYVIIYKCFGLDAGIFHFFCLLIHLVNGVFVYRILQILIENVKSGYRIERINVYSGLVALIFLIHPLQVESVAWISASKVLLYAFFSLLGLLVYLKYLRSQNIWYLLAVLACYFMGFGSKEQAIVFPLNLIVVDFLYGRYQEWRSSYRYFFKRVVWEKIPFLLAALLMWYFSAQNGLGPQSAGMTYPLMQRLVLGAYSFMQYIFHFILPVKLSYLYFFPMEIGQKLPLFLWIYPVLILLVLWYIWEMFKSKNRLVLFGILFLGVNLLMVLHFIPVPRNSIIADRYMYLPIIGIALVGVRMVDYL
ncbi:MAG: hypothetical protein JEZ14_21090, partial [Marinilabiliaceae bacterium]|nr:hypothetical protein [Marinilabiliaceae bacterium]